MTNYEPTGLSPHDCTDYDQLDDRDVRALTSVMSVLDDVGQVRGVEGMYLVVTESGSEYVVDALDGRCTCADAQYNLDDDQQCKHERRVEFATGEREIPAWCERGAVDDQLGQHVDGPRYAHAAADGGVVDDSDEQDEQDEQCLCATTELGCWQHFSVDE